MLSPSFTFGVFHILRGLNWRCYLTRLILVHFLFSKKASHQMHERIAIYPESRKAEPWDRSSVGLSRFDVALCKLCERHSPQLRLSLADRLSPWQLSLVCSLNASLRSFVSAAGIQRRTNKNARQFMNAGSASQYTLPHIGRQRRKRAEAPTLLRKTKMGDHDEMVSTRAKAAAYAVPHEQPRRLEAKVRSGYQQELV